MSPFDHDDFRAVPSRPHFAPPPRDPGELARLAEDLLVVIERAEAMGEQDLADALTFVTACHLDGRLARLAKLMFRYAAQELSRRETDRPGGRRSGVSDWFSRLLRRIRKG